MAALFMIDRQFTVFTQISLMFLKQFPIEQFELQYLIFITIEIYKLSKSNNNYPNCDQQIGSQSQLKHLFECIKQVMRGRTNRMDRQTPSTNIPIIAYNSQTRHNINSRSRRDRNDLSGNPNHQNRSQNKDSKLVELSTLNHTQTNRIAHNNASHKNNQVGIDQFGHDLPPPHPCLSPQFWNELDVQIDVIGAKARQEMRKYREVKRGIKRASESQRNQRDNAGTGREYSHGFQTAHNSIPSTTNVPKSINPDTTMNTHLYHTPHMIPLPKTKSSLTPNLLLATTVHLSKQSDMLEKKLNIIAMMRQRNQIVSTNRSNNYGGNKASSLIGTTVSPPNTFNQHQRSNSVINTNSNAAENRQYSTVQNRQNNSHRVRMHRNVNQESNYSTINHHSNGINVESHKRSISSIASGHRTANAYHNKSVYQNPRSSINNNSSIVSPSESLSSSMLSSAQKAQQSLQMRLYLEEGRKQLMEDRLKSRQRKREGVINMKNIENKKGPEGGRQRADFNGGYSRSSDRTNSSASRNAKTILVRDAYRGEYPKRHQSSSRINSNSHSSHEPEHHTLSNRIPSQLLTLYAQKQRRHSQLASKVRHQMNQLKHQKELGLREVQRFKKDIGLGNKINSIEANNINRNRNGRNQPYLIRGNANDSLYIT